MICVGSGDREGYMRRVFDAGRARGISPVSIMCGRGYPVADLQDDDDDAADLSILRARLQLLELEGLS